MLDVREGEETLWITRAKRGESDSIQRLIEKHAALLWSLAMRLVFDRSAAEELVQAGVVGFLQAIEKYDQAKNTKLITYAVPWILGEMKRTLREMHDACKWISLDECTKSGEEPKLMERIGIHEDDEKLDLRMAMNELKPDEQKAICLRYYRDKTQRETAALLHKSQAQVSRMERDAISRMRTLLS